MGVSERRGLPGHRRQHARMLMAEAGHRRAAGGIEHLFAVLADQPHAFATDRLRRRFAQASVQPATVAGSHDGQPLSVTYCDIAASRASVSSRRFFALAPPSENMTAA